jgi:hypothetical protein
MSLNSSKLNARTPTRTFLHLHCTFCTDTAFFGKYVNGCEGHVPSGWSWWGGLQNTYDFYNATIWEMDWEDATFGPPRTRVMTDIHQADFLGELKPAPLRGMSRMHNSHASSTRREFCFLHTGTHFVVVA